MDKQKAYSTHEIAKAKNASYYFLRGIGMAFEAIRYSTFYYAEILHLYLNWSARSLQVYGVFAGR